MKVLERFALTGKRALVTGGNRGLGKAFAIALAEAGAEVAIAGRSTEGNSAATSELADQGIKVRPITADITDDAAVERTTEQVVDTLGGLDILVNNAGTCIHKESWQITDSEWDQVFALNVRALWKCSVSIQVRRAGRH
jgi:NAD(P)-dependent dehydrogenase (short-subunit alcohol dehydrogenase family)